MEIVITHCRYSPKVETLQEIVRQVINDETCRIIRVSRRDNGCNYRAPGIYDLGIRQSNETTLPIKLTVVGVGHRQEDYETTDKPGE